MSGGLTDPVPEKENKRVPYYEAVAQGATAGALRDSLKDIPDEAEVMWADSYTQDHPTLTDGFTAATYNVTAGIGFKWPASPEPD